MVYPGCRARSASPGAERPYVTTPVPPKPDAEPAFVHAPVTDPAPIIHPLPTPIHSGPVPVTNPVGGPGSGVYPASDGSLVTVLCNAKGLVVSAEGTGKDNLLRRCAATSRP
jgi:hypothetical protein